MKQIGIIVAMREEIIALKRKMIVRRTENKAGMIFYIGMINERDIILVKAGAGKVDAAICTQILISEYEVDCVVSTGVAGGLSPDVNVGDIIISSNTIEENVDKPFLKVSQELADLSEAAAKNVLTTEKVFMARVASDDQFNGSLSVKSDVYTTFTAYCAEMEGIAIAHTCDINQVPFVIIRSISDKADIRTEINYEDFLHVAAKNISRLIEILIYDIK